MASYGATQIMENNEELRRNISLVAEIGTCINFFHCDAKGFSNLCNQSKSFKIFKTLMRYGGTKATNAIQSVVAKGLADVNFGKGYWGALKRVGWLSIIFVQF